MGYDEHDSKLDVDSKEEADLYRRESRRAGSITVSTDNLKRHLGNRQIQLIAIGGSIGTATFVSIGNGLVHGGPGSLLIAYTLYSCMLGLVNNCMAEMAVYMPVTSAFIRMAGKWVDEAFGFMAGWNFFIYEAILIPFEISALNLVLKFWRDDIPVAAVVAACIVLYFLINAITVANYGEAEFWLSSGKVLLIAILFSFTLVSMCGGNPKKDAYGFRYWEDPGSFAEYIATGSLGRFEGFLGALWSAAFTVVGPEYVSMVSGECAYPRTYLRNAFRTTYLRFALFFIGSALTVGIVLPYNDPTLNAILSGTKGGAGTGSASPYVIAMNHLGISVLPHITNALLVTSIFSAGNAYTYCAMRSLYGLALEGQAPIFLTKATKKGVPVYCLLVVIVFPCLAFLNVSSGSAQVLTWLTNVITAAQIIDYIVICVTYVFFYKACLAQGIDRRAFAYYARFQPWSAYISGAFLITVVCTYGYSTFLPGKWSVGNFFTYYTMVLVAPITFFGWKLLKRTSFVKPHEADLVWDKPVIDAYEESFTDEKRGFWQDVGHMIGIRKRKPKTEV